MVAIKFIKKVNLQNKPQKNCCNFVQKFVSIIYHKNKVLDVNDTWVPMAYVALGIFINNNKKKIIN